MTHPRRLQHNFLTGAVDTGTGEGVLLHEYAERVAICREAGLSEREARLVAVADSQRLAHGYVASFRYPRAVDYADDSAQSSAAGTDTPACAAPTGPTDPSPTSSTETASSDS